MSYSSGSMSLRINYTEPIKVSQIDYETVNITIRFGNFRDKNRVFLLTEESLLVNVTRQIPED